MDEIRLETNPLYFWLCAKTTTNNKDKSHSAIWENQVLDTPLARDEIWIGFKIII